MGLDAIDQSAETFPIANDASLEAYLQRIDALVGETGQVEPDVGASLAQLAVVKEIGLEDAVLIALLGVSDDNETRQFFTTTAMAELISQHSPQAPGQRLT